MSALYQAWEARQRLLEREDIAAIGVPLPRELMPIGLLFAELNRNLDGLFHYRPLSCPPPMRDTEPTPGLRGGG